MKLKVLLLFLTCLLLSACSRQKEVHSKEELLAYLTNPEHGLVQNKKFGDFDFTISILPADFFADRLADSVQTLDSLRNRYIYLKLGIAQNSTEVLKANASDRQKFTELLQVFIGYMRDVVVLRDEEGNTLQAIDYNYSRSFHLADQTDFLFVFNKEDFLKGEEIDLLIKNIGIGFTDQVFSIKSDNIRSIPLLAKK